MKVTVAEERLPQGAWSPGAALSDDRLLGLLVLDGLLIREEEIVGARGLELLGRGDLLRPGQIAAWESVPHRARWTVIEPVRLAALDREFQLAIGRRPEITVEIVKRAIDRCRRSAVRLALARGRPLTTRLQVVLWQVADRWGRRRGRMVEIPLRVSHRLLADLACSERASVTRALHALSEDGIVACDDADGFWLLHPRPPTHLSLSAIELRGSVRDAQPAGRQSGV